MYVYIFCCYCYYYYGCHKSKGSLITQYDSDAFIGPERVNKVERDI